MGDMLSVLLPHTKSNGLVRSGCRPADRDEDRGPHGLQDHSEHLHACQGRDAEEGDSEHGRSVREQGEGLTGWDYDGSGRYARRFLCFGLKKQLENGII